MGPRDERIKDMFMTALHGTPPHGVSSATGNSVAGLDWLIIHGFDSSQVNLEASPGVLTKSERAYALVRRAIVTHALPSGVPLEERMVLHQFQLGRTPIREALKRLSYEGMVHWTSHQAPVIRDVAIHEIYHLYETRRILETEIARLAAERADEEDIQRIARIRDLLLEMCARGLVYEAVELDYALHSTIARASKNTFLAEASDLLNLQSLRIWYRAHKHLGLEDVDRWHGPLVDAIRNHDPAQSAHLINGHLDSSLVRQQKLLDGRT